MGDNEVFALIVGLALAVSSAVRWYRPLIGISPLVCPVSRRMPLLLTPLFCIAGIGLVLSEYVDPQVRNSFQYLALFLIAGAAWVLIGGQMLPILGISARQDAIERRNGPASVAICAALISIASVYAGANIGAGPTIWTTFGPAALGSAALGTLWLAHGVAGGAAESITVGRDWPTAWRSAAFYLASAIILSRAVAGDWVSSQQTLVDFLYQGWPAAALGVLAAAFDRILMPTVHRLCPSTQLAGLIPAAIYLLVSAAVLIELGPLNLAKTR